MPTEAPADEALQPRLFSEQMMLEMGRDLVEHGLLSREQLDEINSRRALTGKPLDRMLIEESLVQETDVLELLSKLSNLPFKHIGDYKITREAVMKMQPRVALRHHIIPLMLEGGTVTVAISQVPSLATVDGLRMLLNAAIKWVLCTDSDITKSIKHFYGLGADTIDHLVAGEPEEIEIESGTDVSQETDDAGVIRFVNQIISEAIRMSATDIHIEPFEGHVRLRYRIDGILQNIPIPKPVARLRKAIPSCVKIMADMNIAERRKPHDGRINVRCGDDEFDLRVSILPTGHGETVNMRILNRKTMFIDLEHLGLVEDQMPHVNYLSSLPHGVILLTGPTGSGKTTTLYALLSRISTDEVKIITVEDPIEYQIDGINQIQVHSQIGLTFANILRSILRHDPDIILIGEIRDTETADIAVRASLTGHLVFSTLHTNDAPSAVARLVDMGMEPFLVASSLEGVIAQRLVRRACKACAEETTPDDTILEEMRSMFPGEVDGARFMVGHGCPDCNFTGYRGRVALFEIMVLDDNIRGLVVHQRPSSDIKRAAMASGMKTLRQDGWRRVLAGATTVDEVVRVARKAETPVVEAES